MDSSVSNRKFRLADAMALILAIAAALALIRYQLGTPRSLTPVIARDSVRFDATYPRLILPELEITFSLFLAALSPALLWIILRQPRPKFAVLMSQPGVWACLISTIAASTYLGRSVIAAWRGGWPLFEVPTNFGTKMITANLDLFPMDTFPGLRCAVGPWMAIVLLPLILGRWRVSTNWIEAAGRCLGVSWILLVAAALR